MGFNSTEPRVEYTASIGQDIFTFLFKIYTETDIQVYQTPAGQEPDDTADLLAYPTDYSVTVDGDNGGHITLTTPATGADALTLLRVLPQTRDVEYQTNGDLLAVTLNSDQDYQTYLIADGTTGNSRYLTLPQNSQGMDPGLPAPSSDAYLRWDAAGTKLINDTTIPQNVIDAEQAAADAAQSAIDATTNGQIKEWISEAWAMTSQSFAEEPEDVEVKIYTSNGDGTFTVTPQSGVFSALHWAAKSAATGGTLDGLSDTTITTPIAGDALVYDDGTSKWINGKVLGMPTETNHLGETVSNEGVEGDSSWRNVVSNPTNVKRDETLIANGMMVSPTIDDGFTITVPDNQVLVVL